MGSKLDEVLIDKLGAAKWQERNDAMDVIEKHIDSVNGASDVCKSLVKGMVQLINKDKHSNLVVRAVNLIECLAKRQQIRITGYNEPTLSTCITKFKDNNPKVLIALRSCTQTLVRRMRLDTVLAIIKACTEETTSTAVHADATELLAHVLSLHSPTEEELNDQDEPPSRAVMGQRIRTCKPFIPSLDKAVQHRTPACREAGYHAFAAIRLFLGPQAHGQFDALVRDVLDSQRRTKVDIAYELLRIRVATDRAAEAVMADKMIEDDGPSQPTSRVTRKPLRQRQTEEFMDDAVHATPPPSAQRGRTGRAPKIAKSTRATSSEVDQTRGKGKLPHDDPTTTSSEFQDYFISVPLEQLNDANWKIRLDIAGMIKTKLSADPPPVKLLSAIVASLLQNNRLLDINLQVRCTLLSVVVDVLQRAHRSRRNLAVSIIGPLCQQLVPNLAVAKAKQHADAALYALTDSVETNILFEQLLPFVQGQQNPAVITAALQWLASAITNLNLLFDLRDMTSVIKQALASRNSTVRDSAIHLAGRVHMSPSNQRTDRPISSRLSDEKPLILSRLREEFAQCEAHPVTTASSSPEMADTPVDAVTNRLADVTFAGPYHTPDGDASHPSVNTLDTQNDHSGRSTDPLPQRGVILKQRPLLFHVESNQTSELMEAKQTRLGQLDTTFCLDLNRMQTLFQKVHADAQLVQRLFAPTIDARLEAFDRLTASLDSGPGDALSGAILTYAHFDLIVAWIIGACLGFCRENQPVPSASETESLVSQALQYLTVILSHFARHEFCLSDQEVFLLLRALLTDQVPSVWIALQAREGTNRIQTVTAAATAQSSVTAWVNEALSDIVRLLRQVYPVSSLFETIARLLHDCHTAQSRQLCLQELNSLIPRFSGVSGLNLSFATKLVAQQFANPQPRVRQAALDYMQSVHRIVGGAIWDLVGHIRQTDRQLLAEHLGVSIEDDSKFQVHDDARSTGVPEFTCVTPRMVRPSSIEDVTPSDTAYGMGTRSSRMHSPPPEHKSPAALRVLLPLLHTRDSTKTTTSAKAAAVETLDFALNCLVQQLGLPRRMPQAKAGLTSARDGERRMEDEAVNPSGPSEGGGGGGSEDDEEAASEVNNLILGALIDISDLILDPRTCDILVPFCVRIIEHTSLLILTLAPRTAKPSSVGHTVFTTAVIGVLKLLFDTPYLAREVSEDSLVHLLGSLFYLIHVSCPNGSISVLHINDTLERFFKLIHFILTRVQPTLAFSALLRLLSITGFGVDFASKRFQKTGRRKSKRLSHSDGKDTVEHPLMRDISNSPRLVCLVAEEVFHRTEFVSQDADRISWVTLSPMLDLFLGKAELRANKSANRRRSQQSEEMEKALNELDFCVYMILSVAYARLGSELCNQMLVDAKWTSLAAELKHVSEKMPSAPYPHCQPQNSIP